MTLGLSSADGGMTVGLSSLDGRLPPWYRPEKMVTCAALFSCWILTSSVPLLRRCCHAVLKFVVVFVGSFFCCFFSRDGFCFAVGYGFVDCFS